MIKIFALLFASLILSGCLAFGSGFAQGLANGPRGGLTYYQAERLRIEQERLEQEQWRNYLEQNERIKRMF